VIADRIFTSAERHSRPVIGENTYLMTFDTVKVLANRPVPANYYKSQTGLPGWYYYKSRCPNYVDLARFYFRKRSWSDSTFPMSKVLGHLARPLFADDVSDDFKFHVDGYTFQTNIDLPSVR
jgi:hypothetical protein